MNNKSNIRTIYSEIRMLLFRMIPEKWDSIYLYASVMDNGKDSGEMFFYFYPKSLIKKKPINVYEVPLKFNIDEQEYMKLASKLYDSIKRLRKECNLMNGKLWSNITISIENVEFLAEYNYDDLNSFLYSSEDRRLIWQYKYLNYPIEKFTKEEKNVIDRYLQEEEQGLHITDVYSETFYQEHIHNSVEYGREDFETTRNDNNEKKMQKEQEIKEVRNQLLKY